MKKVMNKLALLCLIGLAVVGCKQEAKLDPKLYAIYLQYVLLENQVDVDKEEALEGYLAGVGLCGESPYVTMSGESSIELGRMVANKLDTVIPSVENDPRDLRAAVLVYGVEKKFLGDNAENLNKCKFEMLAFRMIGAPDNSPIAVIAGLEDLDCAGQWVKDLHKVKKTQSPANAVKFGHHFLDGTNLCLEYSANAAQHFEWDDEAEYITDVIAIKDSAYIPVDNLPAKITVEGREYHPLNNVSAISRLAKDYLYLYATTDVVAGSENYYLNTGCYTEELAKQCRSVGDINRNEIESDVAEPYVWEGHRFIERAIKAYSKEGQDLGIVDFYAMPYTGKPMYLSFVLTYASKNEVEE